MIFVQTDISGLSSNCNWPAKKTQEGSRSLV